MSDGHLATLQPLRTTDAARAVARLPRVKPRSLLTAVVGWERGRREAGEDLLASFAENYWGALCDPSSRAYPVVLQHYTTYVDPKARALVRAGDAQPMGAMPRIIIQGPQSAGAVGDCIDISGSAQPLESPSDNAILRCIEPESSTSAHGASSAIAARAKDDAIDELRAQVAALTASVAQLASIVAAQRGASAS